MCSQCLCTPKHKVVSDGWLGRRFCRIERFVNLIESNLYNLKRSDPIRVSNPSVYLSIYLSICLSICLSAYLSIYLSTYLSFYQSIDLSMPSIIIDISVSLLYWQVIFSAYWQWHGSPSFIPLVKAFDLTWWDQNLGRKMRQKRKKISWGSLDLKIRGFEALAAEKARKDDGVNVDIVMTEPDFRKPDNIWKCPKITWPSLFLVGRHLFIDFYCVKNFAWKLYYGYMACTVDEQIPNISEGCEELEF